MTLPILIAPLVYSHPIILARLPTLTAESSLRKHSPPERERDALYGQLLAYKRKDPARRRLTPIPSCFIAPRRTDRPKLFLAVGSTILAPCTPIYPCYAQLSPRARN